MQPKCNDYNPERTDTAFPLYIHFVAREADAKAIYVKDILVVYIYMMGTIVQSVLPVGTKNAHSFISSYENLCEEN
jgi:hypothetical protein